MSTVFSCLCDLTAQLVQLTPGTLGESSTFPSLPRSLVQKDLGNISACFSTTKADAAFVDLQGPKTQNTAAWICYYQDYSKGIIYEDVFTYPPGFYHQDPYSSSDDAAAVD